jgi:hypothetical protein
MAKMTMESLTEEIVANARRDRARLESCADGLTHGFDRRAAADDEQEQLDPEVAAAFAEEIAGVSEALTNVNKTLLEVIKLQLKSVPEVEDPTKLNKLQTAAVYDEINPQEAN